MADRFHVNCSLAVGPVTIRGPEAHHLTAVLRARPGTLVCLFNGDGREYPARVVEVSRRDVTLEVESVANVHRELDHRLELVVPLPKGDRAQVLVEKLTELGVGVLHLISTRRSVVTPGEAKREKLERQVIEASKQCGRNRLMRIEPLRPWSEVLADPNLPGRRLLAHPGGPVCSGSVGDVVAAVGPEGGFTSEEVEQAVAAGWSIVGLGRTILRVETAALVLGTCLRG